MKTKINDLAMGIIRESTMIDNIDSAQSALMEQELNEVVEGLPTITPVKMNLESVRLFKKDNSYYIELGELHKFSEANDMTNVEALNAIAEYYNAVENLNLTATNFFVAVESKFTYNSLLRLVTEGNTLAATIVDDMIYEVKELQENHVIVKKIED